VVILGLVRGSGEWERFYGGGGRVFLSWQIEAAVLFILGRQSGDGEYFGKGGLRGFGR
jgi:hypothetical protein